MSRTHTFAVLEVSESAFVEVRNQLFRAGYEHAFVDEGDRFMLDMAGLALACKPQPAPGTVAEFRQRRPKPIKVEWPDTPPKSA